MVVKKRTRMREKKTRGKKGYFVESRGKGGKGRRGRSEKWA